MSLKFGTDGVRGVALTELTTEYAAALGRAAAAVLGGGRWLSVGTPASPARPRGRGRRRARRGRCRRRCPSGMLPTPALAWLAAQHGCPAAMITASHNPWQDNGVKIFGAGGVKLVDDVERAHRGRAAHRRTPRRPRTPPRRSTSAIATCCTSSTATARSRGLRVVLDCANGAMSQVAPAVFTALGADVTVIHATPDGRNINDHCGATHTASLAATVVAEGARWAWRSTATATA